MTTASNARRLGLVIALALCGSACYPDDEKAAYSCNLTDTGAVLSGEWNLTATGTRSACDDRRLEGEIGIELKVPLDVRARAQPTTGPLTGDEPENEADAFVERIARADYIIEAEDMPPELEVSGSTVGSCTTFVMTEYLEDGDELHYVFDGYIVSRYRVVGEFTGEGPEDCVVSGRFELSID